MEQLTKEELHNLIQIVGTHPTPQGVGSQEGQIKIALIGKLSKMIDAITEQPSDTKDT